MEKFSNYVNEKTIAIVGPAGYMKDSQLGDLIDSYDIVLRFNSALPIPDIMKPCIGKKTQILANCLHPTPTSGGKINPRKWKDQGVEWLLSPYPRSLSYVQRNFNDFLVKNAGLLKVADTPLPLFESIEAVVCTRPNSGVLTLMYLLSLNVSELYVTGFSFAQDGYYPGYKNTISAKKYRKLANSKIHQQKPQLEYTRKVFEQNPKFKADPILERLLRGQENE